MYNFLEIVYLPFYILTKNNKIQNYRNMPPDISQIA